MLDILTKATFDMLIYIKEKQLVYSNLLQFPK